MTVKMRTDESPTLASRTWGTVNCLSNLGRPPQQEKTHPSLREGWGTPAMEEVQLRTRKAWRKPLTLQRLAA